MRLTVDQVGRIGHASVMLNGITVLAGANNTGKSSLGRALFALLESFHDFSGEKYRQTRRSVRNRLRSFLTSESSDRDRSYFLAADVADALTDALLSANCAGNGAFSAKRVADIFESYVFDVSLLRFSREQWDEADLQNLMEKIHDSQRTVDVRERVTRLLSLTDDDFASRFVSEIFSDMFDGQVTNLVTGAAESYIGLTGDGEETLAEATITRNGGARATAQPDKLGQAILLDDPRIADDVFGHGAMGPGFRIRSVPGSYGYEKRAWQRLVDKRTEYSYDIGLSSNSDSTVADRILSQQDVDAALQKFDAAYPGKIARGEMNSTVLSDTAPVKEPIRLANASMGSKAMMLVRYLFEESKLHDGDILVLDEPEIHLHPHWQITYARFIVTMAKQFGVRMLIATHSPYFMQALMDYSQLYGFSEQTSVYSSTIQQDETIAFKHEDAAGVARIFEDMADPFIQLEQEIADSLIGTNDADC